MSIKSNSPSIDFIDYLIWVLVPQIITTDKNLAYYYDYDQSLQEYNKCFEVLGLSWKWQPVTTENFTRIISSINELSAGKIPIVLNLCDGDQTNNIPGIEVIILLKQLNIIYTGAGEYFYSVSSSKIAMKKLFDDHGIPTPAWQVFDEHSSKNIFQKLHPPVIVKPAVSAGSMGIGISSIVHNEMALRKQVLLLENGYHGWKIATGGIILEEFITGPEFTCLIIGNSDNPDNIIIYPPVQRVFHEDLPEEEKFLSFDRLWEIYEDEGPMNRGEDFYTYHAPDESLLNDIPAICLAAYSAVGGIGYARIDLRMDMLTKKIFVLEVNAQCGLSEDENYTSIGAILRLSGESYSNLIARILNYAIERKNFEQAFTKIN